MPGCTDQHGIEKAGDPGNGAARLFLCLHPVACLCQSENCDTAAGPGRSLIGLCWSQAAFKLNGLPLAL
jgi:hypothetical protein